MRWSYKKCLFVSCAGLFALFVLVTTFLEQSKEKQLKTEALKDRLEAYADVLDSYMLDHHDSIANISSIVSLLPNNVRVSIINHDGSVMFDNSVDAISLTNHSDRSELKISKREGIGYQVRVSASNDVEYLYFAKKFNAYFIRLALPYNIDTKALLESDNFFLYFILLFFLVIVYIINMVAERFSKSIRKLRDFVILSETTKEIESIEFPEDELGQISQRMIENFRLLRKTKEKIQLERAKLLQHIHSSAEGICFFSADNQVELYNGLFVQYLNLISDGDSVAPEQIISIIAIPELTSFLESRADSQSDYFETQLRVQGKYFLLRANIFSDKSYEITLNDITKQEKTRLLKQEMTGNIAHELRTPVTSIRGYLETVLGRNLAKDKEIYFLQKAQRQLIRLSDLIGDMSLLTRIEDNPNSFYKDDIILSKLLSDLLEVYQKDFEIKHIGIDCDIPSGLKIQGNRSLLSSVFTNLIENTIRYAGDDVQIKISMYNEDQNFYYFSYYDTGKGITDESHLNRLFERFYRISEGRTRDSGGTGLGLSIVKNAVAFHKGTIIAKQRALGGLEFLFKFKK